MNVGDTFNYLTLVRITGPDRGMFRCVCGKLKDIRRSHVKSGLTKSCKCKIGDLMRLKHPNFIKGTRINGKPRAEYNTWKRMRQRCENPSNKSYKDYGGRGIRVCERWQDYRNFFKDMGIRPDGMSIERIDNEGNYEPGNCKWADRAEQSRNRRCCTYIIYNDHKITASEYERLIGLRSGHVTQLLRRGWDMKRVVAKFGLNPPLRNGHVISQIPL